MSVTVRNTDAFPHGGTGGIYFCKYIPYLSQAGQFRHGTKEGNIKYGCSQDGPEGPEATETDAVGPAIDRGRTAERGITLLHSQEDRARPEDRAPRDPRPGQDDQDGRRLQALEQVRPPCGLQEEARLPEVPSKCHFGKSKCHHATDCRELVASTFTSHKNYFFRIFNRFLNFITSLKL